MPAGFVAMVEASCARAAYPAAASPASHVQVRTRWLDVHSKEASLLKAPYVAAKHGLIGLAKVVAKEGAKHGVRANVVCPGFVRTPLVDKQIPEQAKTLGISEDDVIKNVMLKETVDGEFTTVADVAEATLFFAAFPTNALTGQSLIVSHEWFME
jgi:3-hydroxybutyrate dehydrogenase